jgi:TonB family protein
MKARLVAVLLPRVFLLTTLLLTTGTAFAADPQPNGDVTKGICAYPPDALAAHAEGTTFLRYSGTTQGILGDLKVVRSSGRADLDEGALDCVAQWRFDPATPLGKLAMGSHPIAIGWRIAAGIPPHGERVAVPHICLNDYPPAAVATHATGVATVGFTITDRGRVSDPRIVVSTGNADLDTASLECVRYWRYRPALKDDKPVAVPWQAEIRWALPDESAPSVSPRTP